MIVDPGGISLPNENNFHALFWRKNPKFNHHNDLIFYRLQYCKTKFSHVLMNASFSLDFYCNH